MSNITLFDEPTSNQTVRRQSRHADKMGRAPSMRRIALSNGRTFKRVVGGEQIGRAVEGSLDVIIVDWLPEPSREYYAAAYDKNAKATLPDCWSNLGDRPDPGAFKPQSDACMNCHQNVKGSGQGDKKACRFKRRLAVLVAGDPSGDVYQISIPSASLFGDAKGNLHPFEAYMRHLRANNEALDTVVTRIIYDTESDTAKVHFKAVDYLTAVQSGVVDTAQDDPAVQRYIQLTTAAVDGAKALPAPVPAAARIVEDTPVATSNPFGDEDGEEAAPEAVEPTKRASKKDEAPKVKGELADVLGEWLDDEEED